jgi:SAM-dependent methyltransferase
MNIKDHFLTQETFRIERDENTGVLATRPMPENLSVYYEANNYRSHGSQHKGLIDFVYSAVKALRTKGKRKLVEKYCRSFDSVLDIGCGDGVFLSVFADKRVEGVEPAAGARELCRNKGLAVEPSIADINHCFDIITLWHVLEHLPNLMGDLNKINSLLSEDGRLFVAVPNCKSWDAEYYGAFWAGYDVPRHVWHFDRESLESILTSAGFEIVDYQPQMFDLFYVAYLSETYKGGRFALLRGVSVGIYAILTKNALKRPSAFLLVAKKAK